MVCPECQSESPASSAYCGRCGRALGEEATAIPRYPDRAALLRREIVIMAVGILLLFGAAFGVWYALVYQRSPMVVVQRFIEADRAGDFALEQQFVSQQWDSQLVLGMLQAFRKQTGKSPFQNYRILGASVSGQSASVSVEITAHVPNLTGSGPASLPGPNPSPSGPTVLPITFTLRVEDGQWKIDAAQTALSVAGALVAMGYQQFGTSLPGLFPPGGPPGPSNPPGSFTPPPGPNPPAVPPNRPGPI